MSKKSIGSRTLKAGAALLAVGAGVAAINAKNKNGTEKKEIKEIQKKFPDVQIQVRTIENRFFGEKITVSGLITGQDLKEQLSGIELGEKLLIPCSMLKGDEEIFLDDMTLEELSDALETEIVIVDTGGKDLVEAVINPPEHKKTRRRQIYEQTSSSDSGKA